MKKRLTYLAKSYGLTVLLFVAAKLAFMLCNGTGHDFGLKDVASVVTHGLSLDLSTALYFLIVPFLLTIASIWIRLPRWIYWTYYGLIAVAFALAFVADTSLYPFWQFKLDASCLQYLATPTEAMASVSTGYLLLRLLVWLAATAAIWLLYRSFAKTPPAGGGRWWEALLYVLLAPLMVIGIRGGLDESTTNIGQVYFSQNQFLNHSAVNPVFSFLSSLGKSGNYIDSYDYYDDQQLAALTEGLYDTRSTDPDTLLRTTRPNVVIIIMESCGGQFTNLGGDSTTMPRLNGLRREGIDFSQCYANSWRTDRGVVSILSGYPAFPLTSVMKIPEKSRKLPSIAASLQKAGYHTKFFYGGDINFTNMRSYLMGTGYAELNWKADYSLQQQATAQWGVRDDLMLTALYDDIMAAETGRPWLKTLLTLSSHEPWDVPISEIDDPVRNAFRYLDQCLGQFVDRLRQTPAWDNLLLIVLPDHGYRYQGVDETTLVYNHVPMLWLGGAVAGPRQVTTICNQSDLPATLLGQLRLPHDDFTFSRDVVGRNYQRHLAYHTYNNGVTVIDSTGFMAFDLDAGKFVAGEGANGERLLQTGRALLQLTSHDLIGK